MKRDLRLFIKDILENIEDIESFSECLTKQDFEENKLKQNAIIRSLEIIGEAVKNIPKSFRKRYPKVPWRDIAGLRDIMIHAYFGILLERVWGVIKKDLPVLKKQIKKILNDLDKEKKIENGKD